MYAYAFGWEGTPETDNYVTIDDDSTIYHPNWYIWRRESGHWPLATHKAGLS